MFEWLPAINLHNYRLLFLYDIPYMTDLDYLDRQNVNATIEQENLFITAVNNIIFDGKVDEERARELAFNSMFCK